MADNKDATQPPKLYYLSYPPKNNDDSTDSDAEVDVEACSSDEAEMIPEADSTRSIEQSAMGGLGCRVEENVCDKSKSDNGEILVSKEADPTYVEKRISEVDEEFSIECIQESRTGDITEDGDTLEEETTEPTYTKFSTQMNPEPALERPITSQGKVGKKRKRNSSRNRKKVKTSLVKEYISLKRKKSCGSKVVAVSADHKKRKDNSGLNKKCSQNCTDNNEPKKVIKSVNRDDNMIQLKISENSKIVLTDADDCTIMSKKSEQSLVTRNTDGSTTLLKNRETCGSPVDEADTARDISEKQQNTLETRGKTHIRVDISDDEESNEDNEVYEVDSESRKCPIKGCGKVFGRPSRLTQHLRMHTGERPFECPVEGCSKAYTRQQHLKRHMEAHQAEKTEDPKHKCEKCGKLFANIHSLKKHQKLHVQQRFSCDHCGKRFRKQQHLKTHSYVHTNIKPYACEYPGCEMRCLTPSRLKRHYLKHEGSRYACPQDECNQSFNQYNELRYHLSVSHPKVCDVCGRTFRQLRQLKKHRLTHDNVVEAYFCPVIACDKRYYQANNLRTHIKEKHAELQIYECGVCTKRLSTKQKLINHMTLHEPNYKRNYASKNPRKPRKDKGTIRRDLARVLSGYWSDDDGMSVDDQGDDDGMRVLEEGKGYSEGDGRRACSSSQGNKGDYIGDCDMKVNDQRKDSNDSSCKGIESQNSSSNKDGCGRSDGDIDDDVTGTLHQGKVVLSIQDDSFDLEDESDDSEKSEYSGDSGYVTGRNSGKDEGTVIEFTDIEDMEVEMGPGN